MSDRSGFRIVAGLVLVLALLAGAAAIGYVAYNAGLAQGAATSGAQVAPSAGAPIPYYGFVPYPYHPFGFGLLSCLIPLFFLFIAFAAMRMMVGGVMGWRRHGGPWGWGPRGPFMPEEMRHHWQEKAEAWHREMHGEAEPPKSGEASG